MQDSLGDLRNVISALKQLSGLQSIHAFAHCCDQVEIALKDERVSRRDAAVLQELVQQTCYIIDIADAYALATISVSLGRDDAEALYHERFSQLKNARHSIGYNQMTMKIDQYLSEVSTWKKCPGAFSLYEDVVFPALSKLNNATKASVGTEADMYVWSAFSDLGAAAGAKLQKDLGKVFPVSEQNDEMIAILVSLHLVELALLPTIGKLTKEIAIAQGSSRAVMGEQVMPGITGSDITGLGPIADDPEKGNSP